MLAFVFFQSRRRSESFTSPAGRGASQSTTQRKNFVRRRLRSTKFLQSTLPIAPETVRILGIGRPGTMIAPPSGMDDGKMPGRDNGTVPEMTVGDLKTHVDRRFEQVDRRFEQVDMRFEQVDRRFDELKIHTSMLIESLRDDIHRVAEGVAANTTAITALRQDLATVRSQHDERLNNHEARLTVLERR
jgi:hypothetical protein